MAPADKSRRGANLVNGGDYGDYQFGGIQLEPSHRDVDLTALELELSLGFATLTSSTSHYSHSGNSISDNSGVYARNGWFAFYGSSPRPMAQAQRFYDDSANTEELRLVSNGHHFVDWTAGLLLTDQSYDLGQNSYLVGYIPYMDAINLYGLAPFSSNQDFPVPAQSGLQGMGGLRRGHLQPSGQSALDRGRPLL